MTSRDFGIREDRISGPQHCLTAALGRPLMLSVSTLACALHLPMKGYENTSLQEDCGEEKDLRQGAWCWAHRKGFKKAVVFGMRSKDQPLSS